MQKELNLPFESAEQLKKGEPVDGHHLRRGAADAAGDDRERPPGNPEDVRLLQGERELRPDRPRAAERRRVSASTGSRRRSRIDSRPSSSRSTRSRRSRSTPASWASAIPMPSLPARPSPSGSRCGRQATDDSHQPPCRRARSKKKKATFQSGQKVTHRLQPVLVLTGVVLAGATWPSASESTKLDEDIAKAQTEATRLHAVIQQVQTFEQQKAQLQQRVVLIEQLRQEPDRPVHMLDQVSRSMPPMLWLTNSETGRQTGRSRSTGRARRKPACPTSWATSKARATSRSRWTSSPARRRRFARRRSGGQVFVEGRVSDSGRGTRRHAATVTRKMRQKRSKAGWRRDPDTAG